jgi:hypothetical protein
MDAIRAWAILDSGATSHFLTTVALMTNMRPTSKPIIARLPNGERVHSMHTCTLNIPPLPASVRHAHIIPGLTSHSLISIITLCNAGCSVVFTKIGCRILYRGKEILCGSKCTHTGLWVIPLRPIPPLTANNNQANAVPIHHYIGKVGYHIYGWSARRCRTLIGCAKLVKHQTGIFQITTLVHLQGTVHLKYVLEFRDY